jgi:hypothetical protein
MNKLKIYSASSWFHYTRLYTYLRQNDFTIFISVIILQDSYLFCSQFKIACNNVLIGTRSLF